MFKHLLVPLDGSPFAEAALAYAVSLADRYEAEITLLRVVAPSRWQESRPAEHRTLLQDLQRPDTGQAIAYLRSLAAQLQQTGLVVHTRLVESGPAAGVILDVVAAEAIDAIVMSTHGRSGLQRWMFGSVAEHVVRSAQVPVLLIRPVDVDPGRDQDAAA